MRALSAAELLSVWERGLNQPLARRALTLLAAAHPDTAPETLADLSIGQRDGRLLKLRRWTFGSELVSVVDCPQCGEQLETAFDVAHIRADAGGEPHEPLLLSEGGYDVEVRLPNSHDLVAISEQDDVQAGRQLLLERCVLTVQQDGQDVSIGDVPGAVVERVAEQMAQADPQADVQLVLDCPLCEERWRATFDIVSFFWNEIHSWAYRVLHQVHTLASAYGWREADILAMSPARRQFYLEMVNR